MVVIAYYSNFLSVEKVYITTSNEVIKSVLKIFAIHGIPQGDRHGHWYTISKRVS